MRLKSLLPYLAVILVVISCFLPWMTIESRKITITGVDTATTSFGKPAYFHFFWTGIYLILLLFNKVWSVRAAVVLSAFNIAWAVRNFLLLPVCSGGECPTREIGLYLLLASSVLMFAAPLIAYSSLGESKK